MKKLSLLLLILLSSCSSENQGILKNTIELRGKTTVKTNEKLQKDDKISIYEDVEYFPEDNESFSDFTEYLDDALLDDGWWFEDSGELQGEIYAVYYRCPNEDLSLTFPEASDRKINFSVMVMNDTSLTKKECAK